MILSGAAPQALLYGAYARVGQALREKTCHNYVHIFKGFLKFLFTHSISFPPVPVQALLAYVEHLVHIPLTYATISNHMSALKSMFQRYGWPIAVFQHFLVTQLLHSIDINVPRSVSTSTILTTLIQATHHHSLGVFLRPLFLLAFFGFLLFHMALSKPYEII